MPCTAPSVPVASPSDLIELPGQAAWRTDFTQLGDGVTLRDFVRGTPTRDAIPALDGPARTPVASVDWIGPQEPVIAVEAGGEWRACLKAKLPRRAALRNFSDAGCAGGGRNF